MAWFIAKSLSRLTDGAVWMQRCRAAGGVGGGGWEGFWGMDNKWESPTEIMN